MVHALYWKTPKNKDELTLTEFAQYKLDNTEVVKDGPLKLQFAGLPTSDDLTFLFEMESSGHGMNFTIDLQTMVAAVETALDFDRFAQLQSEYAQVLRNADTPGPMARLFSRFTPIDDAEAHIWQIEQLQSAMQKLSDQLETEKARCQKFLEDKKAERDRSDVWPPVSVDVPIN